MEKHIILLHGWGAVSTKLLPLADHLRRFHWSVMTLKLPGFEIAAPETPWNLQDYSEYVRKKAGRKWKKGRYFVFGHSFGGRIAINMVLDRDDIAGLILCASGGLSRGSPIKRFVFLIAAKIGRLFMVVPGLANLFKRFLYKAAREHDYERSNQTMKATMKNVLNEDLKKELYSIKVPALILWGKIDKMTPISDAYLLKKNLSKSELIVFKNEGHRLPYNKPLEIALEIEKWYQQLS